MYDQNNIEFRNLKDGSRLLNIQVASLPVSVIACRVGGGARMEETGKEGAAHFLEHIFMDASKAIPNEKERMKTVANLGSSQNAYTQPNFTVYYQIVIPENTEKAMDLLAENFYNSLFMNSDIEKERKIILDEEERSRNNPQSIAYNHRFKGLWPEDRLGSPVLGTQDSIRNIQISDLKNFYEKWYVPENVLFFAIGNSNTQNLVNIIEEYQASKTTGFMRFNNVSDPSIEKFSVAYYGLDQIQISFAYRLDQVAAGSREAICLNFLRESLFSGQISLFGQKIRLDQGLTYGLMGLTRFLPDKGYFGCQIPTSTEKFDTVCNLIKAGIKEFKEIGFAESDLKMYKALHLLNSGKSLLNPNELLEFSLSQPIEENQVTSRNEYVSTIENLDNKYILELAQKYLIEDNLSVTVICNKKDSEFIESRKDVLISSWK